MPSFSELECSGVHAGTPTSSTGDDVDWNNSSLDEITSRLESLDKQLSHLRSSVGLLTHDSSCTRRLLPAFS